MTSLHIIIGSTPYARQKMADTISNREATSLKQGSILALLFKEEKECLGKFFPHNTDRYHMTPSLVEGETVATTQDFTWSLVSKCIRCWSSPEAITLLNEEICVAPLRVTNQHYSWLTNLDAAKVCSILLQRPCD
jgi:hypothetical protein